MFEADSHNIASAPSAPRGVNLQNFWPVWGGGGGWEEGGGWAFVEVPCLLVVCLQHVTQGLEMLGLGFCFEALKFLSTTDASRFLV